MEQQEGGYVGEGLVGNWFEPFSEEFGCFVEDFVELLVFFGGLDWRRRRRRRCCVIWGD